MQELLVLGEENEQLEVDCKKLEVVKEKLEIEKDKLRDDSSSYPERLRG